MVIELNSVLHNISNDIMAMDKVINDECDAIAEMHKQGKKASTHQLNALRSATEWLMVKS